MYTIKPCSTQELQQVLNLSKQWAEEDVTIGYENVNQSIDRLVKRLNDYFFVAISNKKVVGYVFGKIREGKAGPVIPHGEEYLEIFELYVHPNHRKQGIGKKLISEMLKKAEHHNVTRSLVSSSNRRWKDTAEFYEELGYQMWYIQMFK